MTYSGHTIIDVVVLDADGYETGLTVPVALEYVKEVDRSYGEDADGRRGTLLVEYTVVDRYIAPEHLRDLNSAQVEQLLASAERQLYARPDQHAI